MFPTDVCDAIKNLVHDRIGLRKDRILISATHTHSAPSVMSHCLGTGRDEPYTEFVVPRVASGIVAAHEKLQPAKIGWTSVDVPELTNCRRWITRSDRLGIDPFGAKTVRAMMHPGYLNPNYVCPAGPIDSELSVISVVTANGDRPLCVMANFSMHYFGGGAGFSADYFGEVASALESNFAGDNHEFVGIMSQGTSGDLHWMDYSRPKTRITRTEYAKQISERIISTCQDVDHRSDLNLAIAEARIRLSRRLPDSQRLAWAKPINDQRGEQPPRNKPEVYAQQAEWIDKNRETEVVLQAVRIGDLAITAMPNEVYGITGLKLKQQSPLENTFNLELANGAAGYIPPPEQHRLGGYTTWPARSAGLEEQAEPKIVESVLSLLESVAEKPRRPLVDPANTYSRAVMKANPTAYWRLGDMTANQARDTTGTHHGQYQGRVALYMPGPSSDAFVGTANRAVYFAGGHLQATVDVLPSEYTAVFWFWNGLPPEARENLGTLLARGTDNGQEKLSIIRDSSGMATLAFQVGPQRIIGSTPLTSKAWHHVALVRTDDQVKVFLDGEQKVEIDSPIESTASQSAMFLLASDGTIDNAFDGKLDDIALFDRVLTADELLDLYRVSGMTAPLRPRRPIGLNEKRSDVDSLKQYAEAIRKSNPVAYWRLHDPDNKTARDLIENASGTYEPNSLPRQPGSATRNFFGGRVTAKGLTLDNTYSVELWVRNELPVSARPVTGYMFTRGTMGHQGAPGDCLGIGGTHSWTGRLFVFNGNERSEAIVGTTMLAPHGWNHVAMVREDDHVNVFLNGKPEINGKLRITYPEGCDHVQIGGRNDNFANFDGMIDEVAVYDRALRLSEIKLHFHAGGAKAVGNAKLKPADVPQPTSPQASVERIHVRSGYEVQLVASEPLIKDPVAIDWGHDGKLWVVEMADYPLGIDGKGKPGGRVRFLTDTDGDGKYDKSILFADGLSFPTGILAWRAGVLISAAPEILYLEDTTGDGRADLRRSLFSGFLEGNQQLRVNGLRLGLDGWVYCASGSHHAGYGKASQIKSEITGQTIPIGSRDFRIRPDTGEIEAQSGPSQFGRNRDDWGNWFGVQNSHPLWHYVLADQDIRRNPHFAPPDPKRQVVTPTNPPVYPAAELQKRFHSFEQSGRFTSACSAMIYRDEMLFDRVDGQQHAFTCEPFHNLVQHNIIADKGVSFGFRRDPAESEFDFFASRDRWCRPVMVRTGPDGALWVVDMYRYMIEHPEWLPESGKNELLPYYRLGADQGRIYRVVPTDKKVPSHRVQLTQLTTPELVSKLESSSGWQRDAAQQRLIRNQDPRAVEPLSRLATSSTHPLARLHAISTLAELGDLSTELLESALTDHHHGVRRHAVRLSANRSIDLRKLAALANDSDAKVRLQLAAALGSHTDLMAAETLGQLAANSADNAFITANAISSLHQRNIAAVVSAYHNRLGPNDTVSQHQRKLQIQLFRQVAALGDAAAIGQSIERTCIPLNHKLESWQRFGLAELLDGLAARRFPLSQLSARHRDLIDTAIAEARSVDSEPSAARLLLRQQQHYEADIERLIGLLVPQIPIETQLAAIHRLAESSDPKVADSLIADWSSYGPALRSQVFTVLASRTEWSRVLVDAVKNGSVKITEMTPAMRQRFLTTTDKSLQAEWHQVFATKGSTNKKKTLNDFQAALRLKGDARRGMGVFEKHCATCHRLEQVGHDVGPNLAAITDKRPETLLSAILDPSAAVEARFLTYVVLTVDGRALSGLLSNETASSVTLTDAEGKQTSILRSEIDDLRATEKSFMPDGLEKSLPAQQIADLIERLRQ
jgi:putative membrane-bound dehydrogenase-like protein